MEAPQHEDWSTRDSAGVVIHTLHQASMGREALPVAIAGNWEEPEGGFGRVVGGALTDSDAFVLDAQTARVYRYSPEGELLGSFGGPGDGPDEFRQPVAVSVNQDTVVVADRQRSRMVRFSAAGAFVDGMRSNAPLYTGSVTPAGDVVAISIGSGAEVGGGSSGATLLGSRLHVVVVGPAGSADTLLSTPGPRSLRVGGASPPLPYQVLPQVRSHPQGVAILGGTRSDVMVLRSSGLVYTLNWPTAGAPLNDEEWEALRAGALADAISPAARPVIDRSFVPEARPERKPWAGRLVVDETSGVLWVQRAAPFYSADTVSWRLDTNRRRVDRLDLPSGSTILAAHDDRLLLRVEDRLGRHAVTVASWPRLTN